MYVKSHSNLLPMHLQGNNRRERGRPSQSELSVEKGGAQHSERSGISSLWDDDTRRKQGTNLIARQIELENMKTRQFKAKEQVNAKNLELRQDQKVNQYLDKIHKEHF